MNFFERIRDQFSRRQAQRQAESGLTEFSGRDFHQELQQFNQRLVQREAFALARFGDGEMTIINKVATDLSHKHGGEHVYIPDNEIHEQQRQRLEHALTQRLDNYYVGIACPCCVGKEKFFQLKLTSGQKEEQMTWANLFVNSNYPLFLDSTVAALQSRRIHMVCRTGADTSGLPFAVEKCFHTGPNAWINDYHRLKQELKEHLEEDRDSNQVILFCAGVLSNILVAEIAHDYPQITAIDLGSVFDPHMQLGKTRKYLKGGKNLKKKCVWL